MGVLSGKYLNEARPAGARMTLFTRFDRYMKPQAELATAKNDKLARELGLTPATMALAFVHQQQFILSHLNRATKLDQLKENIDSVDVQLSEDAMEAIQGIHLRFPNPSP